MSTSKVRPKSEVRYRESDGKPMGETYVHVEASVNLYTTLKRLFKDRPDVLITADLFFYYEEGNPKAVKAPDVMFIPGARVSADRRMYKLWEEGVVPSVMFEITSKSSQRDDMVVKRELYARLGVPEYFVFDPLWEYLDAQIVGFRLVEGEYQSMERQNGYYISEVLGYGVGTTDKTIRLFDLQTRQPIPFYDELEDEYIRQALADLAVQRRIAEEQRKTEAERERAEAERQIAEAEKQRADAKQVRVDALEEELTKLRAMLAERSPPPDG